MYVCMYVCMYVYILCIIAIRMYVHTYVCMYMKTHALIINNYWYERTVFYTLQIENNLCVVLQICTYYCFLILCVH